MGLKSMRFGIVLGLSMALWCSPAAAWDGAKTARLQDELSRRELNGVVLVGEGPQVVFRRAFGFQNFETRERADVGTAYEVGSVSKPFTATAILMLAERGELSLTDPLTKYFPELPYSEVTLERMLSHTSGLYDVCCQPELRPSFDTFYGKSDPPYSNGDYLAFIEKETPALLAAPGEMFRYSNLAYVLLALIVERVSGTELDAFLKEHIFDPVGLERTYILSKMDDASIDNFALGYRREANGDVVPDVPVATPERPSVFAATYGDDELVSTADDLFAFGQALAKGKLLKPDMLERAWTPALLSSGAAGPYGLGFRVDAAPAGRTIVLHTGSTNGYLATATFPQDENDFTVVVLTNVVDDEFSGLRGAIFDIVWGAP
jgi:CubicO group peptidase (beta-lactamase class C family)